MVRRCILALLATTGAALAAPVVTKAVNTAGYMSAGLPNGGLAQGSYIAIMGTGLGPAIPSSGIAVSGYPLQTSFSGVSAKIGSTDLLIVYATPGQVGAVVPSNTPIAANAPLTVTYNGTSPALNVPVVARAFGVFTLNEAGSGPVVTLKYISPEAQPPSTLFEPAHPGGILTLFGTGLGKSDNPDNLQATNSVIPNLNANDVEVLVGGKKASLQFFGRSNCCAAIDQINVTLAPDTPTGCYVSLVVSVGGVPSNSTTISVAPEGKSVCSDPNGYTEEQLLAIKAKGSASSGYIGFTKTSTTVPVIGNQLADSIFASFHKYDVNQLIRSQGAASAITIGSCTVYNFETDSSDKLPVDPIVPVGLDAGASLKANNSNGDQILEKTPDALGVYAKTIAIGLPGIPGIPIPSVGTGTEYLTTGAHTVTGTGGANVGAFTASINWPAVFSWTNKDAIASVNRSGSLTVNWSGGDPQGYVSITGFSSAQPNANRFVTAGFNCIETASKGTFTVPSAVLRSLPASASQQGFPLGNLSVAGISKPGSFTASGLDNGYVTYQSVFAKPLAFN